LAGKPIWRRAEVLVAKHRLGDRNLKVLSWFRAKSADEAEPEPLADSWRLDEAVPPRARPPSEARPQPRQEMRQPEMRAPDMRGRDARPLRQELPRNEPPRKEAPRNEAPSVHEIRRLLERTADQHASASVQNARRPDAPRLDPARPDPIRRDAPRATERPLEPRAPAPRLAEPPSPKPRSPEARSAEPAQPSLTERFQQMLHRPVEFLRRAPPADEPEQELARAEPAREPMQPVAQVMREPQRETRLPPPPRNAAARGLLEAVDLQKSYGGRRVVNGVGLNVARGEAVGLLGPNGAGKTTVFYMVTGLVKADAGRIELDGNDVTQLPMYRRARLGIGYLPQEASIFRGLTVEDNILAVLEFVETDRDKRMERLNALLDEFKLHKVRKSPSIALSGGERRRCEIARSLATNPSFMLLDEPFAGIDPIAVGDIQELVTLLTQRGIGVLITDHNVRETLGLVNRAYIVHSGTILMEGTPEEIVESRDVRRLYLGEEFRL
jgi:lipopolysaccharide export system ATP-binding protein